MAATSTVRVWACTTSVAHNSGRRSHPHAGRWTRSAPPATRTNHLLLARFAPLAKSLSRGIYVHKRQAHPAQHNQATVATLPSAQSLYQAETTDTNQWTRAFSTQEGSEPSTVENLTQVRGLYKAADYVAVHLILDSPDTCWLSLCGEQARGF